MTPLAAKFTPEERLIGAIVGANWSADATRSWEAALFQGIDWALAIDLARQHGVRPMFIAAAREAGWPGVPRDLKSGLEAAERNCVTNTMCQLARLRDIVREAEAREIRLLALKGAGLAAYLYDNAFIRKAGDLDLLVHPADLPAMEVLLAELGWVASGPADAPLTARQANILNQYKHSRSFGHPQDSVALDMHWTLDENPDRIVTDFDTLWLGRGYAKLADYEVAILGERAMIHYVGMHGARHGWDQWKWIGDIAALLGRTKQDAADLRAAAGPSLFNSWVLLAEEIAGATLPAALTASAATDRRARRLARWAIWLGRLSRARQDAPRSSWLWGLACTAYRIGLKGSAASFAFELRALAHNERDWRAVRLPDGLIPLHFVLRPFLYLARRAGILRQ